ncbi:MAG TPA: SDR family oxidoreductase [Alphaproteobacteria bacterium]|nr:SDR family oxidoreductase [Alphaproteobacteria bacterium]
MAISLQGKAAIVTGAGRGIGRGIAHVFAEDGAKVLVVNRGADAGQAVVDEITAKGGTAVFHQADVKSQADMDAMAAACMNNFGAIDVLCMNAGIYPTALIGDLSEEVWDDVIDTNLKGIFFGTKACIPQMKQQKSGRIVVVSSITGPNVGWPGLSHYMASKGGANAFIRGASLELAKYNITVNGVSPGSIMTEGLKDLGGEALEEVRQIIPAGYIGEPDDIAYALLYLASDQARYVTGQILVVDGGQILPESPTAMADA